MNIRKSHAPGCDCPSPLVCEDSDRSAHESRVKSRPTFTRIFSDMATLLAQRSTCRRAQVGCVIASEDSRQVYSIGYNGGHSGGPNDCDRFGKEAVGNCGCLHAEENAAINCTAPRDAGKVVYCTHLPCIMCAKRLVNLGGVQKVVYQKAYRRPDSLVFFEELAIPILYHPITSRAVAGEGK